MNKKLFIGLVLALAILPIFSMVIFVYAQNELICYEDNSCNKNGDIVTEYFEDGSSKSWMFRIVNGSYFLERVN